MRSSYIKNPSPFFSICVPQYNRTSFFLKALSSIYEQTFRDIEICISDDQSTDGRESELMSSLKASGLSFVYQKRSSNGRYDANLRSAIELASGRFCFLMGNDDALFSENSLRDLHRLLQEMGNTGVAISNYRGYSDGHDYRRITRTGNLGSGPTVAASNFRNFSFVSGIILETSSAKAFATGRWDGSEMYQMYLGCRIIASGKPLVGISEPMIRAGITIEGEMVDSYCAKAPIRPCPLIERKLPLNDLGRVVFDAINPYLDNGDKQRFLRNIFSQIYFFTYPFWIFEYRRVQSWKFAAGICLGMKPGSMLRDTGAKSSTRHWLAALYGSVTFLGLCLPVGLFFSAYKILYKVAKKAR